MQNVRSCAAWTLVLLAVAVCVTGMPAAALAQTAVAPVKSVGGLGYGFLGLGAASFEGDSVGTWHVGGGGEAVFRDAFGVGAEFGYLSWLEESSDGLGVLSVNGAYHFNGAAGAARWRPFVSGGYTLGFDGDVTENLFNIGGGVDYWLKPRVGLRIEFRDHVWAEDGETVHFWGVRFGVTFR